MANDESADISYREIIDDMYSADTSQPDFGYWYGTWDEFLCLFAQPRQWGNPEMMYG